MRWLASISKRVTDFADVDRVLRNHDERIRQIIKHLSGEEEDFHGDRQKVFAWDGMACDSSGAAITPLEVTAGFDFRGRAKATGVGDVFPIPIKLRVGDRIKSVKFRYSGASTATKRFSLIGIDATVHNIHETETATLADPNWLTLTATPNLTVTEDHAFFAQYRSGAANDRFYHVVVTYDRPRTRA